MEQIFVQQNIRLHMIVIAATPEGCTGWSVNDKCTNVSSQGDHLIMYASTMMPSVTGQSAKYEHTFEEMFVSCPPARLGGVHSMNR